VTGRVKDLNRDAAEWEALTIGEETVELAAIALWQKSLH
jgi:hypothetical protein